MLRCHTEEQACLLIFYFSLIFFSSSTVTFLLIMQPFHTDNILHVTVLPTVSSWSGANAAVLDFKPSSETQTWSDCLTTRWCWPNNIHSSHIEVQQMLNIIIFLCCAQFARRLYPMRVDIGVRPLVHLSLRPVSNAVELQWCSVRVKWRGVLIKWNVLVAMGRRTEKRLYS